MKKNIFSNAAYKQLAPYYDKTTNLSIFNIYKEIIGEVENKNILDLGCGTGTLLKLYSKNNNTIGFDGSSEMIKIAKEKDGKSLYKISDIRDFQMNKKFDIIVCAYDTINHLLTMKEWRQVFKNVKEHLVDDGLFIFDYNAIVGLKNNVGTFFQKEKNNFIVREVSCDGDLFLWEFHNFIKSKKDSFSHQEILIKEVGFTEKDINVELKKCFKNIKKIKKSKCRTFVVARKKTT